MYIRRWRLASLILVSSFFLTIYYFINKSSIDHYKTSIAYLKSANVLSNQQVSFGLPIKIIPKYSLPKQYGNYEPIKYETREGAGENGEPYQTPLENQLQVHVAMNEYGINMVASDRIALDRSVSDTRHEECKYWNYSKILPNTSVIVIFHNEGLSVLLRTVESILIRTPREILAEVLLVDDFSNKPDLGYKLERYIKQRDPRIRLIRNSKRGGLIRTRSAGARAAIGEVIVFLDSHCEVNKNWLPPLLEPIVQNPKTLTVPIVDGIDANDFRYRPVYLQGINHRGIFEWGLLYKETKIPQKIADKQRHITDPYDSPTHAGGLLAINRNYFLSFDGYDDDLLAWGGENYELSFKVWMCGGRAMWVPCSRVGHIYRGARYDFGDLNRERKGPMTLSNFRRVVEIWFDHKYKDFFYTRQPLAQFVDMGDISKQLEIKQQCNAHSFSWFMENVAYDLTSQFPELPPNLYWGQLRSEAIDGCVDNQGQDTHVNLIVTWCNSEGNNQLIRLNEKGQLGIGERCIDSNDNNGVMVKQCEIGTVDGPWVYFPENMTFYHTGVKKCMEVHPLIKRLQLSNCQEDHAFSQFRFHKIHPNWE